jgi:hypothetical protein
MLKWEDLKYGPLAMVGNKHERNQVATKQKASKWAKANKGPPRGSL